MDLSLAIVVALGASLLSVEIGALHRWTIRTALRVAVSQTPQSHRDLRREEWEAHLDDIESPVLKLVTAIGFVWAARCMRVECIDRRLRKIVQLTTLSTVDIILHSAASEAIQRFAPTMKRASWEIAAWDRIAKRLARISETALAISEGYKDYEKRSEAEHFEQVARNMFDRVIDVALVIAAYQTPQKAR